MRICPVTPARFSPSWHHATNSPTVISSLRAGTTMLNSTGPNEVPAGTRCSTAVGAVSPTDDFLPHGSHRIAHGRRRVAPAPPAQRCDLGAVRAHHGHVAFRAVVAARK